MSQFYEDNAEQFTVQSLITCAVMSDIYSSNRILEVACGPGRHSVILASSFIKQNSVLVSTDFSQKMVQKLKANYQSSDYSKVKGNKYIIDDCTNYTEIKQNKNDNDNSNDNENQNHHSLVNRVDLESMVKQ